MQTASKSAIVAAVLAIAASAPARASVNLVTSEPSGNSTYHLLEDAKMEVAPFDSASNRARLYFGAEYDFLNNPLVEMNTDHTARTAVLTESIQSLDLTAGAVFSEHLGASLSLPIDLVTVSSGARELGIGDARVSGKVRISPRGAALAIALVPELYLPSGSHDLLLSNGSFGAALRVAFERDFGPVRAAANIGYREIPGARYQDIDYRHQIPMALGAYYDVGYGWGINAELSGALGVPLNRFNNPSTLYLGTRFGFARDAAVTAGVSVGSLGGGNGAGNIGVTLGVKFTPLAIREAARQRVPIHSRS